MAQLLCEVSEGLRPAEATVKVHRLDGRAEFLPVDRGMVTKAGRKNYLAVGLIYLDEAQEAALIELPEEADSGANRLWVRRDHVRLLHESLNS
jgi:hypothetical protein